MIDDTNVKVIEVVLDRLAYGWSPEEIHFQHPDLSLAQIHGALAYYYDHQAELDAEMASQEEEVRRLREQAGDSPLMTRLKAPRPSLLSVRLYVDVHVSRGITQGLRLGGVDVLTAQADGARQLGDAELLDRAGLLGRVLFWPVTPRSPSSPEADHAGPCRRPVR